jgi:hypothetical protein
MRRLSPAEAADFDNGMRGVALLLLRQCEAMNRNLAAPPRRAPRPSACYTAGAGFTVHVRGSCRCPR